MNPFAPFASLQSFRATLQRAVEEQYPGNIRIGDQVYECAVMTRLGMKSTQDGGFVQAATAVFSVRTEILAESVVRDVSLPEKPLRRITITHVETGVKYRLEQETSDPNSPQRRLQCVQAES